MRRSRWSGGGSTCPIYKANLKVRRVPGIPPLTAMILALVAAGGAVVLALLPYGGPPEHLQGFAHAGAFAVISFLFAHGLPRRPWGGLGAAFVLGIAIEAAQVFVPGRSASLEDMAANVVGILAGGLLYGLLKRTLTPKNTPPV